jgi:hypothetical protein
MEMNGSNLDTVLINGYGEITLFKNKILITVI